MNKSMKFLNKEIQKINRQEILEEYGLNMIGGPLFSLRGYTMFQTNSKRDHQNADEILRHQFMGNREKVYRPKQPSRQWDDRFMKLKKNMPLKIEELDSVDKSENLTPSARRNMNLETMEAGGGKDIVKVDDIKQEESEQEFIQLSIEKSNTVISEKNEQRSKKWSTANFVGRKRNSDELSKEKEPELIDESKKENEPKIKIGNEKKSEKDNKESIIKDMTPPLKKVKTGKWR
jgi:hypothetical protein